MSLHLIAEMDFIHDYLIITIVSDFDYLNQ